MAKRFFIVILVFTTTIITAQKGSTSPYSLFGIGENFRVKTVEQASMGGIGVAMKDVNHLNFVNPAAYADLQFATYGIGGKLSFLSLQDSKTSQMGNSTSLQYITLAFPIGKKAGFSAGLHPISSVGYSFSESNENQFTKINGDGGANKFYANLGAYVFKGLSLGIEGGFVFGTLNKTIVSQQSGALASKYRKESTIRGTEFKIGAQYKQDLKKDLQLNIGAAIKLSNNIKVKGTEKLYSLSFSSSGTEIPIRTLYERDDTSAIKQPLTSIFGVGLAKKNKWYVGFNTEIKDAIIDSNTATSNTYKYENGFRSSIGGFYIPKINSINYWNRVNYRAGFKYEKTGLLVNGNPNLGNEFTSINDFGINVGLGLPLPGQISSLNIGFEYGQKGTTNNNLIKENYYNIRLSLSLNSLNWFKKRRID